VDVRLIERAQEGDREAFAELATLLSDRLYAVGVRILRDGDGAGEALQSALVMIWRDLPTLREPARFEAWAHRVMVRRCGAIRRRLQGRPTPLELQPTDAVVPDATLSVSQRDEFERAFKRLSTDQRTVLVLMYYRGLSVTEIAAELEVAEGTVKSRLHYARQAMRAAMEADARPMAPEGRTT
jgi:RNA polymerase sigma-70 factor, ECF subfamily